uniref:Alpha-L-fucosidase 2 n=1 Tax=Solanum tuberosum TaxID=4113 RepID=M1B0H0_SOLTU
MQEGERLPFSGSEQRRMSRGDDLHHENSITNDDQEKSDAQEIIKLEKPRLRNCKIDRIYQFGDSISDTGNCIREPLCQSHSDCGSHPYGINFYQNATGRCSDGMIMIDFIALESGLPLLNPYKDRSANFRHGVNFAVAGCTGISAEIMAENKIFNTAFTNSSLTVQLDWMSSHFETTCTIGKLKKSLFLVGEIGGNEFNYGLLQGKTIEELRRMVPTVVQTIIHGVKRVIDFGATRIIVPGNFPIGCVPIFLTRFMTDNSNAYDEYHCLKDLNNFSIFFNNHLQQAIDEMKKKHPNITLIYGDYYNAYMWLLQNAVRFALECGLPILNPSMEENANFSHGENFAVSGATALSIESLAKKKIHVIHK